MFGGGGLWVSFHTCWRLKPTSGRPGMPLTEFRAQLAAAFPDHKFDAERARQGALRRLEALQRLQIPVPEEIVAAYRDGQPVAVSLADTGEGDRAALDFVVWPERDGFVSEVKIYFASEEHQRKAFALLARLAEVLSWESVDVTDEE
jgi:hypothetical protein